MSFIRACPVTYDSVNIVLTDFKEFLMAYKNWKYHGGSNVQSYFDGRTISWQQNNCYKGKSLWFEQINKLTQFHMSFLKEYMQNRQL